MGSWMASDISSHRMRHCASMCSVRSLGLSSASLERLHGQHSCERSFLLSNTACVAGHHAARCVTRHDMCHTTCLSRGPEGQDQTSTALGIQQQLCLPSDGATSAAQSTHSSQVLSRLPELPEPDSEMVIPVVRGVLLLLSRVTAPPGLGACLPSKGHWDEAGQAAPNPAAIPGPCCNRVQPHHLHTTHAIEVNPTEACLPANRKCQNSSQPCRLPPLHLPILAVLPASSAHEQIELLSWWCSCSWASSVRSTCIACLAACAQGGHLLKQSLQLSGSQSSPSEAVRVSASAVRG